LLTTAPNLSVAPANPLRALVLPKNGPIFSYWLVMIQVLSAGTVILGSNKQEAGLNASGPTQDGIQLTQANSSTQNPCFTFLWKGELWVAGIDSAVQIVIVVPGLEPENLPCNTD
jgi:hypothetical protein